MLADEPVLFFRGLTIFRDFGNPSLFYFLPPEAPRIARSAENSTDYALRLVLYRPDPNAPPPQGMENGGGFLNLDVDLQVSESLLQQATEEVNRRFGGQTSLVPVPFLSGSVELVLLGVGREDEGKPFVRQVAGSTVPALYGSQRAAFSVVLDRDGAALMRSVVEKGGMTMALAIYHLTYAAIPPAYNLKITVDYEKVYESLDLRLKAGINATSGKSALVAKAGFHMLMEELREKRAVTVVEVDPVPGENGRTPTDQARIDEIIGNLMGSKWFKPTLASAAQVTDLGNAAAAGASSGSAGTGTTTPAGTGNTGATPAGTTPATGQRNNAQYKEDSKTPAQFPADRGVEPFQPSTSGVKETLTIKGTGATAKAGPTPDALQPATVEGNKLQVDVADGATQHIEIKWPTGAGAAAERKPAVWTRGTTEGPTDQRGVDHTASASGNSETLTIRGAGATAKVGPASGPLQAKELQGNNLVVDVAPGETKQIEITWASTTVPDEAFHLFFDYERPKDASEVASYTNRNPSPAEGTGSGGEQVRYLPESRSKTTTARGPAALDEWLGTLEPGTNLTLQAHASFEEPDSAATQTSNRALSDRRLQVAKNLIGTRFPMPNATALGHSISKSDRTATMPQIPILDGDTAPANDRGGRPQHRLVLITGRKRGTAQTILRGTLRRDAGTSGQGTPESTLKAHIQRPAGGGGSKDDGTSIQASFEVNLEMIEREEHVVATYELSTRKARTQEVHPQGQLILDVINPLDYIIEADGAIDFFQWLDIRASTTAQWEGEGIDSIHVQLRYAPEDGNFRRTGEIVLSKTSPIGAWKVGVLRAIESDIGSPALYAYEHRVTVHYLPDVAMGDQSGAVTSVGVAGADPEGWVTTTERNLVIHPRDVTPAMMVNISTGLIRFDLLQRVHVTLTYGPYRQNITLAQEHPEHKIVLRPEAGLKDAKLRTEGMLFYKDGAQVPLPVEEWKPEELIVINEPRENILRVQVILADPAKEYQRVNVRLRYEDGNRVEEDARDLTTHAQMEEWAVRLEDPERRQWSYQATLIKASGDIDTIDWTEGKENQLILGVRAVDVIPVQVTWLIPPSGDTLAVKIDLRYVDESKGVRWEHSELIRGQHPGDFKWSVAIADVKKRGYEYRVTQFLRSGAQEEPWKPTTDTMLVLPL